jgi:hypothetical protein
MKPPERRPCADCGEQPAIGAGLRCGPCYETHLRKLRAVSEARYQAQQRAAWEAFRARQRDVRADR